MLRKRSALVRGNLHAHTYHSDGANSVAEMAAEHRRWGLDFGAMTDHNLVNPELALGAHPDFLWLPGEEVTTAVGPPQRLGAGSLARLPLHRPGRHERIIAAAHQRRALTSINHPKDDGPDWTYGAFPDTMRVRGLAGAVVPLQLPIAGPLDGAAARRASARSGVGGSDLHRVSTPDHPYPYYIGNPTTWVYAEELSIPAILAAIMRGHVFISADPSGPELYLTVETVHATVMMGDETALYPGETATVRVEVIGGSGRVVRLLGPDGVLGETFVPSDRYIYEHQIVIRRPRRRLCAPT